MVLIIGTMAVALDGGILMGERRRAQSVADSAVNRGWTREEFREVMLRRSNKGAAKVLEKSTTAARAYLDRCWDKAIKFV
ncbi:MAG: hypothetical protein KGM43_00680, partial [Planctomycetota bacterium]|nr:hypothetical protein [Planctomycetota bacterium]